MWNLKSITRRRFIKSSIITSGAASFLDPSKGRTISAAESADLPQTEESMPDQLPNLDPAKWIWYPSERCLQNTFVLFRRDINLSAIPEKAAGWILADSRYRLFVNGERVQWGPAPCDPRWMEVDPLDLRSKLRQGKNVIGCEVLFYGRGDGTWPLGKPGFLFWLEIESRNGAKEIIASDTAWRCLLARCWKPGHYTRWYLRALQEEFDARLYPFGWTKADFEPGPDWLPAMEHNCPNDKPVVCSTYPEYMLEIQGDRDTSTLSPRSIPLLDETKIPVKGLVESYTIEWHRPPEEYFECETPGSYSANPGASVNDAGKGRWRVQIDELKGTALTFEFEEQIVGWPYFTIEAPEGTIVELMVHEAHEVGGPPLLNTHFHSWTRFICKEGENHFETFDYESLRWMQLHLHGNHGEAIIKKVGVRRRIYPWPNKAQISCSDRKIQRVLDASINTLNNSAQDIIVDGMGRERQQYSGDCGHQLHAVYLSFGETRQPARFLKTFSQGLTQDGVFLDCWPAYDRLARLMERQLDLTKWGPILDHGVGFVFDNYHHYLYTGDLTANKEPYPRLLRFVDYLKRIQRPSGLLPVEDIGTPCVWIDHEAYQQQRHKQCAFNLYAAAMLEQAMAPLCEAFGDTEKAHVAREFGSEILNATVATFWSPDRETFVVSRPWRSEEGADRLCDRSLATAILFDQCPEGKTDASLRALVECPSEMGFSYPANAGWRLWALGKGGRPDVILSDLRTRWWSMGSVQLNNTLQENWHAPADAGAQWSHCPVAPLYVFYMSLAGIRPLEPGFARCEIRPQLGDLEEVQLTAHTVKGPIRFESKGAKGDRRLKITLPENCEGELLVPAEEKTDLDLLGPGVQLPDRRRYRLPEDATSEVNLRYC